MNRIFFDYRYWSALLALLLSACTSATDFELVTESGPTPERRQAPVMSELKFPIYSPLPRVLGKTDSNASLRPGSFLSGPYHPPMLYEFPLNQGCCFLPQEVE